MILVYIVEVCYPTHIFWVQQNTGYKNPTTSEWGGGNSSKAPSLGVTWSLVVTPRSGSIGEVENLPWISCIGSRSSWVAGTSIVGHSRVLSGGPNTKWVWALKAVINGPCSHDSRTFTRSKKDECLRKCSSWGPSLKVPEAQKDS